MEFAPTDPHAGLASAEAAARLAAGQSNRTPGSNALEYAAILRRNTLTPLNALVVPAAVSLFLLKDMRGAWAVGGMALANCLIGLVQETRAKIHLDRLSLLGEPRVRVLRDGVEVILTSAEVVKGDILPLSVGDTVVADGTIVQAAYLEIDESLLTGESDPVPRAIGEKALSGSVCVAGEGAYRAEGVGTEAFAQQTAAAARRYTYSPGPTQRTLEKLIRFLTAAAIALCLGYGVLHFVRGLDATELAQMVAATITTMVPQGLVLMATLAFTLGAVRLGKSDVVVRRLSAIEAMSAVDIICTDKTGTLTTGRLKLEQLVPFHMADAEARRWLATFAAAMEDRGNKSIEALRTELAGVEPFPGHATDKLPFKSQNRYSAVRWRDGQGERSLILGSFEALRDRFSEADRSAVEARWGVLLPTGLRLLAFASGDAGVGPMEGKLPDGPLRPIALLALRDELRPEAAGVLDALAAQEIRFKIVSGDHPDTVQATVRHVGGRFARSPVLTGDEWASAPNRTEAATGCDVFGRVSPAQKLELIETLQAAGHHVGMIGDGVNDILAIKKADFGVSMGGGTPATKAVAGMVLESNDFAALPVVLAEARIIVRNVRRAAKLFLLKNAYTVALILVAVGICRLPFPYLPQQVTLLNLLTIGGPAALILAGRSPAGHGIRRSFLADVGRFVLVGGAACGIAGLGVYLASQLGFGHTIEKSRTLLLTTLVLAGLGYAILATRGDRRIVAWAVFAVGLHFLAMHLPPTAYFFVLDPLTAAQIAASVAAAAAALLPGVVLIPPE